MDHIAYCRWQSSEDVEDDQVLIEPTTSSSLVEDVNFDDNPEIVQDLFSTDDQKETMINEVNGQNSKKSKYKEPKTCLLCNKSFASQFTLNRHLTSKHNIQISPGNRVLQCPAEQCYQYFNYVGALRVHLKNGHDIKISDCIVLQFPSMEVFQCWKGEEERRTHTKFVRPHGKYKRHDGAEVHQFYCHRSGHYNPEGKGLRRLKSQGSCKMGAVCPATMTAYQLPDGKVDMKYYSTHVGHITDLEELYFSYEERADVNRMVAKSVPFSSILNHVRDSLQGELNGLDAFIKMDVDNIKKWYKLWCDVIVKPNSDDNLAGIASLVQELEALGPEDNPIFYHKASWEENEAEVKADGSSGGCDRLVVVMDRMQVALTQKFGNDGIICIDTISDVDNKRSFMVSMMAIDDMEQAFPCALAITNRIESATLSMFFAHIKEKVGVITPRILMTDTQDGCFSAWTTVMGFPPKVLLSSWQMDKALRKNLSKIAGKPCQKATFYKAMRVLLREPDVMKFDLLLTALLRHLMSSKYTEAFGKYLSDQWVERRTAWANSYRDESCRRCDLELEALHMLLRYVCSCDQADGDSRPQLDTLLRVLFQFLRDKNLSRVIRNDPTYCTQRATAIRNRHHASLSLSLKNVTPIASTKWIVKSQQGEFLVERNIVDCGASCALRCAPCGFCVHTITCSCTDSIIRGALCKHIHLVGRFIAHVAGDDVEENDDEKQPDIVIVAAEGMDTISDDVLRQLTTVAGVNKIHLVKKVDQIVGDIVACSQQLAVNVKDVYDFAILKQIRQEMIKLVALSQGTERFSEDASSFRFPINDLNEFMEQE